MNLQKHPQSQLVGFSRFLKPSTGNKGCFSWWKEKNQANKVTQFLSQFKFIKWSQAWWCKSFIPALRKTRQEDPEFDSSMRYKRGKQIKCLGDPCGGYLWKKAKEFVTESCPSFFPCDYVSFQMWFKIPTSNNSINHTNYRKKSIGSPKAIYVWLWNASCIHSFRCVHLLCWEFIRTK